jgi:RHS repeat-associated protein
MRLSFNSSRLFLWIYLVFLPFWLSSETVRTFQYNKNNQLIKEEKANGYVLEYEYDPVGHLIKETASDGSVVEYAYDKNGTRTVMMDSHGTTLYVYDPLGRLVAVEFPSTPPITYKYDAKNRLKGIAYPNGWEVFYEYDASDRLVSVIDRNGIAKYEYDNASNLLVKETLPNGVFTEYQYDGVQRITNVTHKQSDGMVIASYQYGFDANGNRTEIKETSPYGTKKSVCKYDKLNRLLSVEYEGGYERFTYDGLGNRLSKETPEGIVRYEYDQSNRLTKAGDTQFFYDRCGNLIKKVSPKSTAEFTYDTHDNLIQFRDSKHTVQYGYDGAGRRISKTVDGITTHYINDVHSPAWQVILQLTDTKEVNRLYTYGLSRIAEVFPKSACFYLYDYPDRNVIGLVNRDQDIINHYQYSSFGSLQKKEARVPNTFTYTGEAYEEESQLIYLRNRYYDPELGRFISPDPDFGSIMNPQSLNPYTYVNNNPLNYIDPLGLRSAKASAYVAGTKTERGKSFAGHGFWELTYDNGTVLTIGRYPGGAEENRDKIVPGTVSYEWPATDDQIDQIIASVKKGGYYCGVAGNCVDGLERGLAILGVKHPSFSFCGISLPTKAVFWLESLNGRSDHYDAYQRDVEFAADPDRYMAMLANKPKPPPVATRSSGNTGGVSLNKTAQLLGKISDIEAATYDDATGQLIMMGKKHSQKRKKRSVSLPKMDFDDLAVAVRSIYGLNGKAPQDPGVSLDPDPKHPVDFDKILVKKKKPYPLIARYLGQTKDTRFGNVMFEADRILKCLSLGKNNKNGKKMRAKVSGFKTLPERHKKNRLSGGRAQTRLWFIPKKITLHKNSKGTSIAFKEVKMQVLTETKIRGMNKKKNPHAEAFANHLTKNYAKYAKQYPVLKELERLGKITALVKWMKKNKIPLDLSLFKKYKPAHRKTPKNTPSIVASVTNEKQAFTMTIVGGVVYHLDESNFHEVVNKDMSPLAAAAKKARPSENVFSWTFTSPLDSSKYEAVAQTVESTVKIGNVRKACLDMRSMHSSEHPLELIRYYNSFNDDDMGFGRGWDVVSSKLLFPRQKVLVTWRDDPNPIAVHPEILVEELGTESRYALAGLRADRKPLYKAEDGRSILVETNKGYILSMLGEKRVAFSFEGKIVSRSLGNKVQMSYRYNGEKRLVEIVHANGAKIELFYNQGRIVKAVGPGSRSIQYSHSKNGQLQQVKDALGIIESYSYDADKNLNAIRNCRKDLLFEAVYDKYHRASVQTSFGKTEKKSFDLKAHTLRIENAAKGAFRSQYDANYRLLQASDSENRSVKITYEGGRPKTISDCLGNEKRYTYDGHGNIIRIVDALGVEERFWYNEKDQLFASVDGVGKAELYLYNEQDLLTKIYHAAQLIADDPERGEVNFRHNPQFVTEYGYDPESRLLLWIKQGGELVNSFSYNQEGMLVATTSPDGYTLHRSYDTRGRLSRIWDSSNGSFEYRYDDRDRLVRVSSPEGEITYVYDDVGGQNLVQDACGGATTYSFDAFGNILKIQDPTGGETRYEYGEEHVLKRINLPNGSIREIGYDRSFLPKEMIW